MLRDVGSGSAGRSGHSLQMWERGVGRLQADRPADAYRYREAFQTGLIQSKVVTKIDKMR